MKLNFNTTYVKRTVRAL